MRSRRLRFFLALGLYSARGDGWCKPTRLGRLVARLLGLWPQRIRWEVQPCAN